MACLIFKHGQAMLNRKSRLKGFKAHIWFTIWENLNAAVYFWTISRFKHCNSNLFLNNALFRCAQAKIVLKNVKLFIQKFCSFTFLGAAPLALAVPRSWNNRLSTIQHFNKAELQELSHNPDKCHSHKNPRPAFLSLSKNTCSSHINFRVTS